MKYCVYLTVYYGNKLPPFYIGSSSIERIRKGYHGSVSSNEYKNIWKDELKNNKNNFKTFIISFCDSRESAFHKENEYHTKLNVVSNPLYTNKWVARVSDNYKPLIGKENPMYGKKHKTTTKQKISESAKGRKHSVLTKDKMKCIQQNRSVKNSWNQIKDKLPNFRNYNEYHDEVISLLELYCYCPTLVASKMMLSSSTIITFCKKNNIEYNINQKYTKLVKNYGNRWKNYNDYENDILFLHDKNYYIESIAKELNINSHGILEVLKSNKKIPLYKSDILRKKYAMQIIDLYKNNTSINKIKLVLSISEHIVRSILKENNLL